MCILSPSRMHIRSQDNQGVCRQHCSAKFYKVIQIKAILQNCRKVVCVPMALIQNTPPKQRTSWFDPIYVGGHSLWMCSSEAMKM